MPKNAPNICPNVGWIADFHEPQADLDANFNGRNIMPDEQHQLAAAQRSGDQRADGKGGGRAQRGEALAEWGQIDKLITESAAAIPWIWEDSPTLYSNKVTHASELWNGGEPDVSFMSVK